MESGIWECSDSYSARSVEGGRQVASQTLPQRPSPARAHYPWVSCGARRKSRLG